MKIHTYYTKIPALCDKAQEVILELWRKNWLEAGFDPVVIGQKDAEAHPWFDQYSSVMCRKPMMNMPQYELACFYRWCAMAQVGGGLMADYDCFNRSAKPKDFTISEMTIYEPPHIPCLVSGSALEYQRMMELFMRFETKDYKEWLKPHSKGGLGISDMLILANHPEEFKTVQVVRQPNDTEWETSKAIHFSNNACGGQKMAAMQKWLQTRRT